MPQVRRRANYTKTKSEIIEHVKGWRLYVACMAPLLAPMLSTDCDAADKFQPCRGRVEMWATILNLLTVENHVAVQLNTP